MRDLKILPTLLDKELFSMEMLEGLLWATLSGPAGTVAQRFLALGALAASGGCIAFLIYVLKLQRNLNT